MRNSLAFRANNFKEEFKTPKPDLNLYSSNKFAAISEEYHPERLKTPQKSRLVMINEAKVDPFLTFYPNSNHP